MAVLAISGQAGLYQQLIPKPTGLNAYEDYLLAADVADRVRRSRPELPPDAARLTEARVLRDQCDGAFKLVRVGNGKRILPIRPKVEIETRFPEYTPLRNLGRMMVSGAYALFADGKRKEGTDLLLDLVVMGDNIARTYTLIGYLSGRSMQRFAYREFANRLSILGLDELAHVNWTVQMLLQQPEPYSSSLIQERTFLEEAIDKFSAKPEDFVRDLPELAHATEKLSPAEREELRRTVRRRIADYFDPIGQALRGAESGWPTQLPAVSEPRPPYEGVDQIGDAFFSALAPSMSSGVLVAGRSRDQLRILGLCTYVERYRWEHSHYPDKLADAVPPELLFDEWSGRPFGYAKTETGYRLYGLGKGETGEFDLRNDGPRGSEPEVARP